MLGVEQSARGYRWVERLDVGRDLAATAISQAHGLPELLGRVLAARGAESHTVLRYLDPTLRSLLPDPTRLQDMVFISAEGSVHRIESNTEPFSTTTIPSDGDVVGVLELNAGEADKIGLKRGDKVIYPGLVNPGARR